MDENQESLKFTCKKCAVGCIDGENCIQCQDCKTWIHYKCSKLPPYQLFLYESTQRKYTCEFCAEMDEDFNKEYNSGVKIEELECHIEDSSIISPGAPGDSGSKKLVVSTSTEAYSTPFGCTDENHEKVSCQLEEPKHPDQRLKKTIINELKLCQTEEQLQTTNLSHASDSMQAVESLTKMNIPQESISSQTEEPFYDFEQLKTLSIAILQESFVKAFDQINSSIRTMTINQSEENELRQRIVPMTKEIEKLREDKKSETKEMPKSKAACQNCSDSISRVKK